MREQQFSPDKQLRARMWITMLLLGAVYGLFVFVLFALGGSISTMLIVVVALVLFQVWMSDRMVLSSMKAKMVTPAEAPELHRMVERLAQQAGIPKPKVAISAINVPNAFATGRSQKTAAVAVTNALIETLTEKQLEAVVAHEISHIRTKDVVVMTYASFFSIVASTLMSFLFWSSLFGGMGRSRHGGGAGNAMMVAYVVTIIVWLVSQLLVAALSRYREYAADRGAVELTGQPTELADALQRIAGSFDRLPQVDLRKAESMNAFFIMPAIGDGFARVFSTHPPMSQRVARLRALPATRRDQ